MKEQRTLVLSHNERLALERMAGNDPKPHMKRRARALLLIADGHAPYWVARKGLDKAIAVNQVYMWLDRYQAEGIKGLAIRPGRGRKPAYFPWQPGGGVQPDLPHCAPHT